MTKKKIKSKLEKTGDGAVLLAIGITLGVILAANYAAYFPNLSEMLVTCDGIEHYYTNTTFEDDYVSILSNYTYKMPSQAKSPLAIWKGEPVDCETMSIAVMCLSRLYPEEIECAYYTKIVMDQTVENKTIPFAPGHQGTKCRNVRNQFNGTDYNIEKGSWSVYY